MKQAPNTKLYKECAKCGNWTFGQFDLYCPRCGSALKDGGQWLASISDYAKSLLIEFLTCNADSALRGCMGEIPDYATEHIRVNGNVMFNQAATRRVLAENWNQVETALDDWRETNGTDFPVKNIEQLHVFSVAQHAEMIWREITRGCCGDQLNEEDLEMALEELKR
jgi:hypothetical protein